MTKIAIEDASAKQLRHFAGTMLGLEVAPTENGPSLRSKIETARPGLTEIDVEDELPSPPKQAPAAGGVVAGTATIPGGKAGMHSKYDPKVRLSVLSSADPTKSKDVQVNVNGEVILIKRDSEVEIPYRHYLVLRDAKEDVARDTGEMNPVTSMPIKEWVSQPSYPLQVFALPPKEAIEAWEKRTAVMVME